MCRAGDHRRGRRRRLLLAGLLPRHRRHLRMRCPVCECQLPSGRRRSVDRAHQTPHDLRSFQDAFFWLSPPHPGYDPANVVYALQRAEEQNCASITQGARAGALRRKRTDALRMLLGAGLVEHHTDNVVLGCVTTRWFMGAATHTCVCASAHSSLEERGAAVDREERVGAAEPNSTCCSADRPGQELVGKVVGVHGCGLHSSLGSSSPLRRRARCPSKSIIRTKQRGHHVVSHEFR